MERRDLQNTWLCAGLVLGAIALTFPIAESGVNDDWSYTKTALDLARTGHVVYNGWSAAMLGVQAYWGALFIKVFGFSFLAVRLSTAPLAAGCAGLLYALHRRAGLPAGLALFGTLTVVLSPVFIPNAASFMTEVPAFFLFLASVYGYARAGEVLDECTARGDPPAAWRRRLWGWALLGLGAGVSGGTVRQTNWLLPLLAPAFLLGRRRTFLRLRPALFPLTVSALAGLGGAITLAAWFRDQPYAVQEKVGLGVTRLFTEEALPQLCLLTAFLIQTLGVLLLPVLVGLPALYRRWLADQEPKGRAAGGALLAGGAFWFVAWLCFRREWVFPWLGNTFSLQPFLTGSAPAPPGSIPTTLPVAAWRAFSLSITASVCAALALAVMAAVWPRRGSSGEEAQPPNPSAFGLLGIFAVAYVPLLLLKGLVPSSFGVWDRYLLPLMPLATIGLLRIHHRWTGRDRAPSYAWGVLACFACYGVAQAHDYFAQLRARTSATGFLERRGIPRTRILAGFEYDGWTQLTVAGHYNDPRIERPAGLYVEPPDSIGFDTSYQLWRYAPVVRPDYVVALVRHPDLIDTDAPPVPFSCWLPPFRGRLTVQVSDPALRAVTSLPVRAE